jgi:hypothetical protein
MPKQPLELSPEAISGYQPSINSDFAATFTRWSFGDGTQVTSRSICMIDGNPVCVEQLRFEQTIGDSIVKPLSTLDGFEDDGVQARLYEHMTIAEDRIARERGFFAVRHGSTSLRSPLSRTSVDRHSPLGTGG